MAKWEWNEAKETVKGNYEAEVVSYGWSCADCGTDLDKYLRESGYMHPVDLIHMKRKAPKLDYCPACGAKKGKE
jgi:rubrerythrin